MYTLSHSSYSIDNSENVVGHRTNNKRHVNLYGSIRAVVSANLRMLRTNTRKQKNFFLKPTGTSHVELRKIRIVTVSSTYRETPRSVFHDGSLHLPWAGRFPVYIFRIGIQPTHTRPKPPAPSRSCIKNA